MKDNRMKDALEAIARRGVPENTDLWPDIAARLERKSPIMTLRTRPIVALLIALLILLALSGAAYALSKVLGYIPGVGIVDQSSPLRVLAEPVSQTRDGITVAVKEAVLSADRTIVIVAFEDIPMDKIPHQVDIPNCFPSPALRLPEGDPLQPSGSQGNAWSTGSEYHFTYAAVPATVNEATLFIGCVPGDVLPSILPENWELPLRFVPAPPDMTALPVIEYTPSPAPTGAAETNPISITKVIDLGNSYILMGKFTLQSNSLGYTIMDMRTLVDANGNILPWRMPQDSVFPPSGPDGSVTAEDWAVQVDKGFVPPLTIKFSTASSYPTANDAPLEFEFNAGDSPKTGDEWQVNQDFDAAGHSFTLVSIRADTDPNMPGSYGYRFSFKPLEDSISNIYLEIKGYDFTGYTQNENQNGFDYFIGYSELPKGKLKVSFSLELRDTKEWTLQWQPEDASSNSVAPTETAQACLTLDSWKSALANPQPLPSDLTGRLLAYGPLSDDYLNYDNYGSFMINLDGSSKQSITQGIYPSLSPDGKFIAFAWDQGLNIMDLASGGQYPIPNTTTADNVPVWSPDGTKIAFTHGDDLNLYTISPDGTNLTRVLDENGDEQLVGWTPDGSGLYYGVSVQGGISLRKLDIASGGITEQLVINNRRGYEDIRISPDENRVAFHERENLSDAIYVSNLDGSNPRLVAQMGHWVVTAPFWSPDGKWLIVVILPTDRPDQPSELALVNLQDCRVIPLAWRAQSIHGWIP